MTKRTNRTPDSSLAEDTGDWDYDDPEIRALSRNAAFRALLRRTREGVARQGTLSLDELHEALGLTPDDEAEGERLLAQLERETEDEDAATRAARRNGPATPGPRAASKARGEMGNGSVEAAQ